MNESLHDDSSVDDVSLLLNEAVLPGRRETMGDREGEGGVGVHGGEILLHRSSDPGGHVFVVDLREFARDHTIHEPCTHTHSNDGGIEPVY